MKTTLDIPDELISTAMREVGCKTKTAAIVMALEQMVRLAKLAKLRDFRGRMPDLNVNLDDLRSRN